MQKKTFVTAGDVVEPVKIFVSSSLTELSRLTHLGYFSRSHVISHIRCTKTKGGGAIDRGSDWPPAIPDEGKILKKVKVWNRQ